MLSQMGYQRPHPWYPSFACDDNPLTHVIGISIYALLRPRFSFFAILWVKMINQFYVLRSIKMQKDIQPY